MSVPGWKKMQEQVGIRTKDCSSDTFQNFPVAGSTNDEQDIQYSSGNPIIVNKFFDSSGGVDLSQINEFLHRHYCHKSSNEVVDDDRFGIGSSFKNKAHFNAREAKKAKLEPPPSPPKELMGTSTAPTTMEIPATPVYTMPPTPVYGQPPATPMYGGVPPPATPLYQAPPAVVAAPSYPPPQIAPGYGGAPAVFQTPPPTVQTTSVDAEILRKESADCVDASGVFCLVCQIGVTSKAVMETHLKGSKHLKKLKMAGRMVPRKGTAATESILETLHKPPQQNDWSLYRMPSGKYYCKSCNSIMADEKLFSQHWYGKKHKLKVKQEMEELLGKAGGGEAKGKFYNRRPFGKNRYVQPQAQ